MALVFIHLDDKDKDDLQVQLMLQASEFGLRIELWQILSRGNFTANLPVFVIN